MRRIDHKNRNRRFSKRDYFIIHESKNASSVRKDYSVSLFGKL